MSGTLLLQLFDLFLPGLDAFDRDRNRIGILGVPWARGVILSYGK